MGAGGKIDFLLSTLTCVGGLAVNFEWYSFGPTPLRNPRLSIMFPALPRENYGQVHNRQKCSKNNTSLLDSVVLFFGDKDARRPPAGSNCWVRGCVVVSPRRGIKKIMYRLFPWCGVSCFAIQTCLFDLDAVQTWM